MKKNFFKKLAFVLALAMVITSIAPAAVMTSQAAPAIVKSNGSTFSGTYSTGKTFKVKLSGVTGEVKWKSSNKDVATVGLTSGTVKTWGAGEATITATVVKTGKTYKKVLKIYERATSFTTNYDDGISLKVGDTPVTINTTLTPSNSTDDVVYVSSNKEVATVGLRGGKVTPVKNGSATITVYSKTAKSTSPNSATTIKKEIKVTVGEVMETATQTAVNEVEAIFNVAVTDVKATDFTITNNSTKVNYAVKEIKKVGNKVTITTYQNMNDGKDYTVKCGDAVANFTATNGQPASITIDPVTVQVETETSMTAILKDANGVILETVKHGSANTNVTFTIETNDGYIVDDKLSLQEVGKTAKAKAVYHTYKYDDNATEIGTLTAEATITAIPKVVPTFTNQTYTIAKDKPSDWSKVTTNSVVSVGRETNLWVYFKDSTGKVAESGYTLESSNSDKLLVTDKGNMSASITGLVEGTEYVLVKKDDVIVYSCPVAISKAGVASSIVFDKTNLVLSNSAGIQQTNKVKVTTKDQYGNEDAANNVVVECLTTSASGLKASDINDNSTKYFGVNGNEVDFKAEGLTAGTYTYKVSVDKLSKTFVVTIKAPSGSESTRLLLSTTTADTKFEGANKQVEVRLGVYKGGVLDSYVDLDNTTTVKVIKDGKDVTNVTVTVPAITTTTPPTTQATIETVTVGGNNIVSKAPVGDYKVEVTHGGKKYTAALTIKDSQGGLKVERTSQTADITVTASTTERDREEALLDALKFDNTTVEGNKVGTYVSMDVIKNGNAYSIKSVTMYMAVEISGTTYKIPATATLGKTVVLNVKK